MIDTLFNIVT